MELYQYLYRDDDQCGQVCGAVDRTGGGEGGRITSTMRRRIILLLFFAPLISWGQEIKLVNLRCEYRVNPQGVGSLRPRLSWELQSGKRGVRQSSYRILVSEDTVSLEKNRGTWWDSRMTAGDTS